MEQEGGRVTLPVRILAVDRAQAGALEIDQKNRDFDKREIRIMYDSPYRPENFHPESSTG